MNKGLSLDLSKVMPYADFSEIEKMEAMVKCAHETVHEGTGAGNDFLGWLDLPVNYDKAEFDRIKKAAEKIKSDSDVLVVIGIGGSYLGARAAIEMLKNHFYNVLDNSKRKTPQVFFVGNNISSTYVADLLEVIEGKDISVNVISKSGTTTEPAIAFRIFKDYMEKKYGVEGAKSRIYATTDKANALYNKGKNIEVLVNYEPALHYFNEWWKQLYGESEGKDQKGIFPAAVDFSTDLHSMGQFIQDGSRIMFETVLNVENPLKEIVLEEAEVDTDGLNFLAGKTIDFVNKQAFKGTLLAHNDGGVPNMVLNIPELSAYYFGQMVYFFEKACAISGYLLGVNPFDQPGVEAYKKNMFALLGKPGYEELKAELESRLK